MKKLIRPLLIGATSMALLLAIHGTDMASPALAQTSGQGNQTDSAVPGQRMPGAGMVPGMGPGMGAGPGMMQGQGMPGGWPGGWMQQSPGGPDSDRFPGAMPMMRGWGNGYAMPGPMMHGYDDRGTYGMRGDGAMGPGMMHPGMMGSGMMGQGMIYGMPGRYDQEITPDQVREMLQRRLDWHGNPRLKLGEIKPTEHGEILADIVTREGSLVQRLAIDRRTGALRQVD
ncbi:hypothetical protein [Oceanibaculum pacificum]|uniref:PepSY domain-containing protein n=1 Tax=Oceanibaculum pacificum TaxID=580166 RepID=A0A154VY92_9PROT|nr:hypothetical protein [Oceanibaculum pacificum]KZD06208.1 hypothetical protein AUP43_11220 [Oceanibaculum pacificum]